MNKKIILSVIIPVYNVERYIEKCIDSVIEQYCENIEIICVNDGTTDNSKNIIEKYINKHEFIKCLDRENGGLSAARNSGLLQSKGEYILFLDSDDWLEKNVLSELCTIATTNNLDILVANTKWIYPHKIHKEEKNSADVLLSITDGKDAIAKLMASGIYVPMAYNYICKRDFILSNKLFFKEGLIYEDELWTPQIFYKAKKVFATNVFHYNYYQREQTITNSHGSLIKVNSFFHVSKELITSFDFSNDQNLKNLFWLRATILYDRGKLMKIESNISNSTNFSITWIDLMKAKLSKDYFYKCLGFLRYSKNQRRIIKLIYRAISK